MLERYAGKGCYLPRLIRHTVRVLLPHDCFLSGISGMSRAFHGADRSRSPPPGRSGNRRYMDSHQRPSEIKMSPRTGLTLIKRFAAARKSPFDAGVLTTVFLAYGVCARFWLRRSEDITGRTSQPANWSHAIPENA